MRKVQNSSADALKTVVFAADAGVKLLSEEYDPNVVGTNVRTLAEFTGEMLPITTEVIAAYILAPCLTGALAFSLAGPSAAYALFTMTKLGVLGYGGKKAMKTLVIFIENGQANVAEQESQEMSLDKEADLTEVPVYAVIKES